MFLCLLGLKFYGEKKIIYYRFFLKKKKRFSTLVQIKLCNVQVSVCVDIALFYVIIFNNPFKQTPNCSLTHYKTQKCDARNNVIMVKILKYFVLFFFTTVQAADQLRQQLRCSLLAWLLLHQSAVCVYQCAVTCPPEILSCLLCLRHAPANCHHWGCLQKGTNLQHEKLKA